jgi:hypothetical protein
MQQGGSEQYGGILIRGATGQLWFMRADGERPELIEDDELERQLTRFAERQPEGMLTFPLPDEIRDRLAKNVAGVIPWGVIIWWAHRLSR